VHSWWSTELSTWKKYLINCPQYALCITATYCHRSPPNNMVANSIYFSSNQQSISGMISIGSTPIIDLCVNVVTNHQSQGSASIRLIVAATFVGGPIQWLHVPWPVLLRQQSHYFGICHWTRIHLSTVVKNGVTLQSLVFMKI